MSKPSEVVNDIGAAAVKALPPAAVWAWTVNEWLALAGIVWIVIQAAYLIRKWFREERAKRAPPSA